MTGRLCCGGDWFVFIIAIVISVAFEILRPQKAIIF